MPIMEEFGSNEAFTSDRHFVQAGFVALLRTDNTESSEAGTPHERMQVLLSGNLLAKPLLTRKADFGHTINGRAFQSV